MDKKRIVILGSTGSIGTSALKVARDIPERMEVVGLAAHSSVDVLAAQVNEFGVRDVCLFDPAGLERLRSMVPADTRILCGLEGLCELATLEQADMVLVSIIGSA